MTTTQDLIAQLRALGIPDWAMARVLMTQAADTLEALQAEVANLRRKQRVTEGLAGAYESERDAALARLAESEAQNLMARQIILEHGEGVAGASPVEPSQALSLDLLERLNKTLTRLGYATPEGGMEHFNADLANQLYNLCRAVDSLFDREQPPAPSDTAITYMTGYSDGREWAGATNQAQPSQAGEFYQAICKAHEFLKPPTEPLGIAAAIGTLGSAINAKQPSQAVELSQQEAEALAHRRASKYAHRSDSSYVAYTFLPHTLMDFVRDVTAAINAKGQPNG